MEEIKNKYYIRLNENGRVVKTFSDVFENAMESDILIGEGFGSQFRASSDVLSEDLQEYAEVENGLQLMNDQGIYILKYENGVICKVSDEEIQAEIDDLPESEPSEIEKIKTENVALRSNVVNLEAVSFVIMEALIEVYENGTYGGSIKENFIVEIYVKLIVAERKTIEEVPEALRDRVAERLGELNG